MTEKSSILRTGTEFFKILKFIAVALIITYVVQKTGGARLLETIKSADVGWVAISAVCFFLSIALGSVQWFLLLRFQGVNVTWLSCFKIYYLGMFTNALIFNLAGDALRIYKLKKWKIDVTTGFLATFLDRFTGLFVLSLYSLIAVLIIWQKGWFYGETVKPILFGTLFVFLGFTAGALAIISRRVSRLFRFFFKMMGIKKVETFHDKLQESLAVYRHQWGKMSLIILTSCGIHSLRILGHACCAPALGVAISCWYFFAFIPIISIATLIPLNLGGWGLPQGISISLYNLPGVITAISDSPLSTDAVQLAASSITFLPSAVFYVIMLMGGFFAFSKFQRKDTLNLKSAFIERLK
ncbi:MAG: flippase-like domain-containing protein [Fibrobacteria bacterium]|nr:flippase-like domain-containing protein [Fibrobacteria bacterium]